jgi:hypothetical protein
MQTPSEETAQAALLLWAELSRTVPAVVPARHAKIHAEIKIFGGCVNFHQFL